MKAYQLIQWGNDVVLDVKHQMDCAKYQAAGMVELGENQEEIFITVDLVFNDFRLPCRMNRKIPAIYIEQGYVTKQEVKQVFISQLKKVTEVYQ